MIEIQIGLFDKNGEEEIWESTATVEEDDSVTVAFTLPDGKILTIDGALA